MSTAVFWNGRNGYAVPDGTQVPAFSYSAKQSNRSHSKTNSQAMVLAQFRPEMVEQREKLRMALRLLCDAKAAHLFGDNA